MSGITPQIQDIPKASSSYKKFNITTFTGIDCSESPFAASPSSASDALNVYVDDEMKLATRPRLNWDNKFDGFSKVEKYLKYGDDIFVFGYVDGNNDDSVPHALIGSNVVTLPNTNFEDGYEFFLNSEGIIILACNTGLYYLDTDYEFKEIYNSTKAYIPTTVIHGKYTDDGIIDTLVDYEAENILSDTHKEAYFFDPTTFQVTDAKAKLNWDFSKVYGEAKNIATNVDSIIAHNEGGVTVYKTTDDKYYWFGDSFEPTEIEAPMGFWDGRGIRYSLSEDGSFLTHSTFANNSVTVKQLNLVDYSVKTTTVTGINDSYFATTIHDNILYICTVSSGDLIVKSVDYNNSSSSIGTYTQQTGVGDSRIVAITFYNNKIYAFGYRILTPTSESPIIAVITENTFERHNLNTPTNSSKFYIFDGYIFFKDNILDIISFKPVSKNKTAPIVSGQYYQIKDTRLEIINDFNKPSVGLINAVGTPYILYLGPDGYSPMILNGSTLSYYEFDFTSTWQAKAIAIIENETDNYAFDYKSVVKYDDKIWFYNSSDTPNKIIYSNDASCYYISKYNYTEIGDNAPITSLLQITDDYLGAFKKDSAYLIYENEDQTDIYFSQTLKTKYGNIPVGQAIVGGYSNLPIVINDYGIFGMVQSENSVDGDTIFKSISDKINPRIMLLKDKDKIKTHNHNYLTYFYYDKSIWVLDNRTFTWFYWEIPVSIDYIFEDIINYGNAYSEVVTKIISENNLYSLTTKTYFKESQDSNSATNDIITYQDYMGGLAFRRIKWKWKSQPLTLNVINYVKKLSELNLIFADEDRRLGVIQDENFKNLSLFYKVKGYRKKSRLLDSSFIGFIDYVGRIKLRPRISKFDFVELEFSNYVEDDMGNITFTYDTKSTTNNDEATTNNGLTDTSNILDKFNLIGIAMRFVAITGG